MTQPTQTGLAGPVKVVASFTYTIDDLREGLAAPVEEPKAKGSSAPFARGAIGWAIFIALTVLIFALLQRNPPRVTPRMALPPIEKPTRIDARLILIPSATAALCVGALVGGLFIMAYLGRSKSEAIRKRSPQVFVAACMLCAVILAVALVIMNSDSLHVEIESSSGRLVLFAFVPWMFLLVAIIFAAIAFSRGQLRWQWKTKPSFQRRRTVELTDDAIRNIDEMGDTVYKWAYFRRAWETKNELVLEDEAPLRHILPKRAFEEVGGLDAARAIIGSNIADSRFLTKPIGFPVQPILVPPPIPQRDQ